MSNLKFVAIRNSRYQRSRNRSHHGLVVYLGVLHATNNSQRMKTIPHQAIAQRRARREIPPPDGMKARNRFPLRTLADLRGNAQPNDLVPKAPVQNVAGPRQHSNAVPGGGFPKL